jgi:hypothetical protein
MAEADELRYDSVSGDQTSEYKGARELDTLLQFTKKYNR